MPILHGVKIVRDRTAEFSRRLDALTKSRVMVGIPAKTASRKPDQDEATAPLNNAALGYIHEFGAPEANIPARPFLTPGVKDGADAITPQLRHAAAAALAGDDQGTGAGLNGAGLAAQNAVRQKITQGPFAPLSPVTLAQRRRRGRTGEKPLIDTGQLRNAITYVIRKG